MRYAAHTPQDLLCPLCNTVYEDEMHILFYCKSLEDLRQKYSPTKYVVHPSVVTLRLFMQDEVVFMTWVDSSTILLNDGINDHVHKSQQTFS